MCISLFLSLRPQSSSSDWAENGSGGAKGAGDASNGLSSPITGSRMVNGVDDHPHSLFHLPNHHFHHNHSLHSRLLGRLVAATLAQLQFISGSTFSLLLFLFLSLLLFFFSPLFTWLNFVHLQRWKAWNVDFLLGRQSCIWHLF